MNILSQFLKTDSSMINDEAADDTPKEQIEQYLHELKAKQAWWANEVSIDERINLLKQVQQNIFSVMNKWIDLDGKARKTEKTHWDYVVSATTPGFAAVSTRLWLHVLEDIRDHGKPVLCRKIRQEGDHVALEIIPQTFKDKILFRGVKGVIHLQPGTRVEDFNDYQFVYGDPAFHGAISLVLASGNYAHLVFSDILHKLIMQKNVVLVKTNPVKEYMFEIIQEVFKPFIDAGVVRVVKGGKSLCTYVAHRPLVNNLHMTGSDRTFEAIMYGNGEEGVKNKKKDQKLLRIPMTGELGCVTPIIIIPGKWSNSQFHYQAKNIVTMLGFNSGFSCCAPRVLIMPKGWDGSLKLMNLIRHYMKKTYISSNYYPGTNEVIKVLENKYPTLEKIGPYDERHQPWMLVADIDPEQDRNQDEYLFHTEIWAAFMCQVYLSCDSVESYLMAAVEFANTKLWGNLSAMIIVDKKTQRKLEKTGSLAKAIKKLCYGTVSINMFSGYANSLSLLPWGGYPTSSYTDIQSGNVYVNNIMMLRNVEKSVLWAPFYLWPEPPLFITHKKVMQTAVMFSRYNVTGRLIDFLKTMATVVGLINPRV